jgi:hypothetical protein
VDWSLGDGPAIKNYSVTIGHTWTNAGDYTVTFTAYNNDNPLGVSASTIVHVQPLNVPQLQSPALVSNSFRFQFNGQVSAGYTVQYATNLTPPVAWQTLQNIGYSTGGIQQIIDSAATNGTRFYRVLAN